MKQTDRWAVAIVAGVVGVMTCTLIAASSSLTYGAVAANRTSTPLIVNATDDIDDGSCDSMHCSLREAINAANNGPGPDTITFDPLVFPPTQVVVIGLGSMLPTIYDDNLTIDASGTQAAIDGSALVGEDTHGFFIQSSGNTLKGIRIHNVPGAGVMVASFSDEGNIAHYNTLDSITVVNSGYGGPPFNGRTDAIWIEAYGDGSTAYHNRVVNCTVENNADDGIEVVSHGRGKADYNAVIGNTVRGNAEVGIEIDAQGPGSASYNIVADNMIEGTNTEGNGGIIVNSHGGGAADGNTIHSNIVVNCRDWGIAVLTWDPGSSASANMVINNTVEHNSDRGIAIHCNGGGTADGNTIDSNTVIENTGLGIHILAWDPGSSASANMVINNTVEHNSDCGIAVDPHSGAVGDGNCIYHNNFIENGYQPRDNGNNTRWDYSGKGNYWSDYTGKDENDDGIGDTPYRIPPKGVDNYPLMTPYTYEQRIYLPVIMKNYP